MYLLRLLGGASLERETGPISGRAAQQRPLAVLAILAVAREKGCSRDKLIGCLWSEADQERARHRLANAVYELRRSLGEGAVLGSGEVLRLDPNVIKSDVWAFQDAVDANELESAAGLYEGPLLDGFHLDDGPEFERWLDTERQRLGERYAKALEQLARQAEAGGDDPGAVGWWTRLLAYDPYNSRVAMHLMQAMAQSGDRANALQLAQEHERLLRDELDLEPGPEFVALSERLRREPASVGEGVTTTASGPTPVSSDQALARAPLPRRSSTFRNVGLSLLATVVLVGIVATGWFLVGRGGQGMNAVADERPSVAVLPLANRGGPEDDYFTDGIHDEILTQLTKISGLSVRGRTSVMQYRNPRKTLRQIGEELNARYILEGGVQRAGETVRINIQLVDAESDEHLWAETYDRLLTVENLLGVQSEVALRVAESLEATLTASEALRIATMPTDNLEAYENYIRGQQAGWIVPGTHRALEHFARALVADSSYSQAWTGLAGAYISYLGHNEMPSRRAWDAAARVPGLRTTVTDPATAEARIVRFEMIRLATEAAEKALALDSTSAYGLSTLVQVRTRYWFDYDGAEEAYLRAIELQPGDARVLGSYVRFLGYLGRADEALEHAERAVALDPLSVGARITAARIRFWAGQQERALREMRQIADEHPSDRISLWHLANLQVAVGEYEQAIGTLRRQMSMVTPDNIADETGFLGFIFGLTGQVDSAYAALERLDQFEATGVYVSPATRSAIYSGLGDFDEAFALLNRAVEERDGGPLLWIRLFPPFNRLSSDSRYPELLRRVGLSN